GQRPFMWRKEVFDRTLVLLDERRGDPVWPRRNEEGLLELHVDAIRVGYRHPAIERDHGSSLTVDRELDVLVLVGPSVDAAGGRPLDRHPERVLAVRGEVVHHAHAAARAVRSPL